MRGVNVQWQADRRGEILAAAQACFARSGFHQTSMQEICAEAGVSPGNLYRYFRSKEDIIAGIAERDRAETAQQFAAGGRRPFFECLAPLAPPPPGAPRLDRSPLFGQVLARRAPRPPA